MSKSKTKNKEKDGGSEPLSEFQDTKITGRKEIEISVGPEKSGREYTINSATIKDGICNYSFDVVKGVGLGDVIAVKGTHIVKDSMRDSFVKFNVHMALYDDVFKHNKIEIEDIDKFHNHELTTLYHVTGIQIVGEEDNESIILIGNKYVSSGGRIEIKTPKIALDNLSSYKWYNELKAASDDAREEVALYKEGNYELPDQEEEEKEKKKPRQLKIVASVISEPLEEGSAELDPDFAEASR